MESLLSGNDFRGHKIHLQTSDPRHIRGSRRAEPQGQGMDFKSMVFTELDKVNNLQMKSDELSRRLVTDPDSVDAHDVTIALAEANMALNITKGVIDRVIRAYRDILATR